MKTIKILFSIIFVVILCSCSNDGTSTGNPMVQIKYDSYNSSLGYSTKAVSNVKFCIKRLRFKPFDSSSVDNIDFDVGMVTLSDSGGSLGFTNVPAGTYRRIEIDLDNTCESSLNSVELNNDSGAFSTNDKISVKFDGLINIDSNKDVLLFMQNIIDAIDTVTSNGEIKTKIEGVSGSF